MSCGAARYGDRRKMHNHLSMIRAVLSALSVPVRGALFGLALVSTACGKPSEPALPPNIIFILADDLGYGDLGAYGQQLIETPYLDAMAAEGMRFTQHYAGSTVCAPSRCVLLTGRHTGHAAIRGNGSPPLPDEEVTLAELLKRAGYRTGVVGKWGLGGPGTSGHPLRQGFDYFFGFLSQIRAHNYYPDYVWEDSTRVDLPNQVVIADRGYAKGMGSAATRREVYIHDRFSEKALDFVESSANGPFFLYLAYTIPHANNEFWLTSDHGMEVPDYGRYADRDWPEAQRGTAAMISRLDRDVGRLFQLLKEKGIDRQTIVFFSSDNGPHAEGNNQPDFFDSNGPFRGIKRDLYEGGIRVPLLVRWPGVIPPGTESDRPSAFWDFLPTACALADVETPPATDGLSLLPTLQGQEAPAHPFLYWEFFEQGGRQALRMDDWKAVRYGVNEQPDAPIELYDLQADPGETRNVAQENPEIVERLRQTMQAARTPSAVWKFAFESEDEK